jgi:hypothetical protein
MPRGNCNYQLSKKALVDCQYLKQLLLCQRFGLNRSDYRQLIIQGASWPVLYATAIILSPQAMPGFDMGPVSCLDI